jgi:hypothetical protein
VKSFRHIIEAAGATFLSVDEKSVFFSDPQTGKRMSIYKKSCRTAHDVELALHEVREPVADFEPLEPTSP